MKSKNSLYLVVVSIVFAHATAVNAQQFTKVTTGNIVNTPSGSRSCNFLDVNNDNYEDILITNGKTGGENNMLYINNGDETFTEMNDTIMRDNTPTDGATCADYDNDGYVDVFAVNWYNVNNIHYKNNNGNAFIKVDTSIISSQNGYSETAAWGDVDNDGLIDLFVTNSAGARRNFLYQNLGGGAFQPVTGISPVTDNSYSRCVNWIDIDGDGDQDLFVSNENNQHNDLYRNEGGLVFTKITGDTIVSDNFSSMSSSWADYDNDGDFDLFVANYQQNNQLFNNDGAGNFSAVTGPWSTDGGCSFGSSFADADNDGDLDLFVTNGYCVNNLSNFFYVNNGDGTFTKELTEPMSTATGQSFGCAWGDYTNNGFQDLVVANWQGETQANFLFKNEGNGNGFVKLKLEGTVSNRSAIGTVVKCKAIIDGNAVWQVREVSAQTGYCSQNSMVVHFGLDDATVVDSLQVSWPSGIVQNFENLNLNQSYSLMENGTLGATGRGDLIEDENNIKLFPNPSNGVFTIQLTNLQGESGVIEIFDITGKQMLSKPIAITSNKMTVLMQDLGAEIPQGTYTVNVVVNQQIHFRNKLVIIK